MKFYHLTDLHYCSKASFDGDVWKHPIHLNQINERLSEETIKQTFARLLNDDEIDTYIVTGDLCNVSDKESRAEVVQLFREIVAKGKRLLAYPASHDFSNDGWLYRFDENGKEQPNMNTSDKYDVEQDYLEFGYNQSIAQYPKTYSYVTQLEDNLRYIALRPLYAKESNYSGMYFEEEYIKWIEECADNAKKDGCMLFASVHYPLMTPSLGYSLVGSDSCFIKDYDAIVDRLSAHGIDFLIAGHTHIHDVARRKTPCGATFNQITTSSLSGYPPLYRKIDIDVNSRTIDIKTIEVGEITTPIGTFDMKTRNKENFIGYMEFLAQTGESNPAALSAIGGVMEDYEHYVNMFRYPIKKVFKFLNNLTYGKIADFVATDAGFSKDDYIDIYDKRVEPMLFELCAGTFDGEQKLELDSMEHKIIVAGCAALDSMLEKAKIDVKGFLKGNSLEKMISTIMYDEEANNSDLTIELDNPYPHRTNEEKYNSTKGLGSFIKLIYKILSA